MNDKANSSDGYTKSQAYTQYASNGRLATTQAYLHQQTALILTYTFAPTVNLTSIAYSDLSGLELVN